MLSAAATALSCCSPVSRQAPTGAFCSNLGGSLDIIESPHNCAAYDGPVNIRSAHHAVVGGKLPVYAKIYVPLDKSDHSNAANQVAVRHAGATNARPAGRHVSV